MFSLILRCYFHINARKFVMTVRVLNRITISVAIYAVYCKGLGVALSLTVIDISGPYVIYNFGKRNIRTQYLT